MYDIVRAYNMMETLCVIMFTYRHIYLIPEQKSIISIYKYIYIYIYIYMKTRKENEREIQTIGMH